jgi:hypothetical protein
MRITWQFCTHQNRMPVSYITAEEYVSFHFGISKWTDVRLRVALKVWFRVEMGEVGCKAMVCLWLCAQWPKGCGWFKISTLVSTPVCLWLNTGWSAVLFTNLTTGYCSKIPLQMCAIDLPKSQRLRGFVKFQRAYWRLYFGMVFQRITVARNCVYESFCRAK